MREKAETALAPRKKECWFLYIIECVDGSFYTGITKDLERRLVQHNAGRASRYTRVRRPVRLRHQEKCLGRTEALIRECAVKSLSRREKEALIRGERAAEGATGSPKRRLGRGRTSAIRSLD